MLVTFKSGNSMEFERGATLSEIAKSLSEGLFREAVAAKVNGVEKDLSYALEEDAEVTFLTVKDEEGLHDNVQN